LYPLLKNTVGGVVKKKRRRRLTLRQIKEILRLKDKDLSNRQIAKACNISPTTVEKYIEVIKASSITYDDMKEKSENEIMDELFKDKKPKSKRAMPDMNYIHKQLKMKGVTLQLLWEEYKQQNTEGYSRTQFCYYYNLWKKKLKPTMRFNHKAGEKVFVDFSGDKPAVTDPETGEKTEVELFVGTLGASSYTFAMAIDNQKKESWIDCHKKMFSFFGGVPEYVVPDNLKSGVTSPDYYDPQVNITYAELAEHYNVAILPARPIRPRDKSKVENAVLNTQRRILARLRNRTFFSMSELNRAIRDTLDEFNNRKMQQLDKSRYELFCEIDKPALRKLPEKPFEIFLWKKAKVGLDYHITLDGVHYSIPYTLISQTVEIRYNNRLVEVFHNNKKVCSHPRSFKKGEFITSLVHMPHSHKGYMQWTPDKIKTWADSAGVNTSLFIDKILEHSTHKEHAFRMCLGVMSLAKKYKPERLENACLIALSIESYRYRTLKAILKNRMDENAAIEQNKEQSHSIIIHKNIRGNSFYAGCDL
jgi:transposase